MLFTARESEADYTVHMTYAPKELADNEEFVSASTLAGSAHAGARYVFVDSGWPSTSWRPELEMRLAT